ncbi:MAG: endonuclease/exonuclease/phosphatase family protein [Flavobacteriales bacterium]|nr:endonuclease/exonuclease/phosphatase family protein [Flavobacteriales bacterium]
MRISLFRPFILILASVVLLQSCQDDVLSELPEDPDGTLTDIPEFRIASYNIHGGKGPNDEGAFGDNISAFSNLLQGEDIVCLQEVEPDRWNELKALFPEYPYRYFVHQCSTKFATKKQGGNAILSKFPIQEYSSQLIQTDPGGDKWERKAEYVRIYIGNDHQYLNVFHYHNTYNWHNDNSASEKAGFKKFVDFVESKSISENEMVIVLGDFNLNESLVKDIIPATNFPHSYSNWVDHIFSNQPLMTSASYETFQLLLSDHDAVWAVFCNLDC